MPRLFFELVGPHYELAKAEISGGLKGLSFEYEELRFEEGVFAVEVESLPEELFSRLGLTHRVHRLIAVTSEDGYDFSGLLEDHEFPEGSIAVRTEKVKGGETDTKKIREELGDLISGTNSIDLESPDHEIFALVSTDLFLGKKIYEVDRKKLRGRQVKNRPFSSPISLKPWFTIALINLARPSRSSRLHDPFCGTGGLLIEGGKMGLEVSGGDKDPEMIKGCEKNLNEFDVKCELKEGDVSQTIPEDIEIVATDPPYGRASSTSKEDLKSIYQRLFEASAERLKEGGRLAAIFPEEEYISMGEEHLELLERYRTKVHGSLDRNFTVFKKPTR
ncbi:MAG: methyltransferase [Candidatus Thermoplasmatota archaeon]